VDQSQTTNHQNHLKSFWS